MPFGLRNTAQTFQGQGTAWPNVCICPHQWHPSSQHGWERSQATPKQSFPNDSTLWTLDEHRQMRFQGIWGEFLGHHINANGSHRYRKPPTYVIVLLRTTKPHLYVTALLKMNRWPQHCLLQSSLFVNADVVLLRVNIQESIWTFDTAFSIWNLLLSCQPNQNKRSFGWHSLIPRLNNSKFPVHTFAKLINKIWLKIFKSSPLLSLLRSYYPMWFFCLRGLTAPAWHPATVSRVQSWRKAITCLIKQ